MDDLLSIFLAKAGIYGINKRDLHFQLLTHPDNPSLKAITDTFDYFEIENIAATVPKSALDELPQIFLAEMNEGDVSELVLVAKQSGKVEIVKSDHKKELLDLNVFIEKWTGTILAIEREENISQAKAVRQSYSYPILIIASLLLFGSILFSEPFAWYTWIYHGLSLLGLFLSYLIIKEQLGVKDSLTAKVCGAISSKPEGCTAVINNRRGKIYKNIGLGDISLIYYAALVFGSFILGLDISFLYLLAIASLPVVAFTLFAQTAILKSWCMLCLGLSCVLLAQFGVLHFNHTHWEFTPTYMLSAGLIAILVVASWINLRKFLYDYKSLSQSKSELYKFKRNPEFFFFALQKNRIKNLTILDIEDEIIFGNPNAKLRFKAISNPLCGFCSTPFSVYYRLLSQYSDEISIQFVFNTPQDPENASTKIVRRVIEIYRSDRMAALEALRSWFDHKDLGRWFKTFGEPDGAALSPKQVLEKHRDWCYTNELNYTPETIINDCCYPREQYEYTDLFFFIEDLKEITTEVDTELV